MDRELKLKEALEYIDPTSLDYQEWVGIGMGLKEAGYTSEDWDRWSSRDPKRYHPGECARKWNSFRGRRRRSQRGLLSKWPWNTAGAPTEAVLS